MNLIELEAIGSTNDHAKELARQGAASGTVVWAHAQSAGKGRQGNTWVSIPGNLFMTMILRPRAGVAVLGQLSFLTAVALAETLEALVPDVRVKWPNDVLVGGFKTAGILIETEGNAGWAVVGIGVNITSAPPGAMSLKQAGVETTARQVLEALVARIEARVDAWEAGGFEGIRADWLARAHRRGAEITARLPKETLTGIFDGIDATGALQLRLADGAIRTINSGEVYL